MTDIAPDADIKPAATILLLRDDPAFEVLMVKRHHQIDFASGALVFPGGKSHEGDHDPAWADHTLGHADFDAEQRGLRIAAIREVFEEAGILLASHTDGSPMGDQIAPMDVRQAVDRGETAFLDVVKALDAKLDLHALTIFARWITPPLTPKRFDTWFYTALAPEAWARRTTISARTLPSLWVSGWARISKAAVCRASPARMAVASS